ncbi:hypothetical protein ACFFRR_010987 [Megaselia abdita]
MELKGTYSCSKCDKVYSLKKNLNRHVKLIHYLNVESAHELVDESNSKLVDECEHFHEMVNENQAQISLEAGDIEIDLPIDSDELSFFVSNDNLSTQNYNEGHNLKYIQFVLKYMPKPEIPRSYVVEIIRDLSEI